MNPSPPAPDAPSEMYWWDEIINEQVDRLKMDVVFENTTLWSQEVAALRKYCDWRGDVEKAIAEWKSLVAFRPSVADLHAELERVCDMKGDVGTTITVWDDLICHHSSAVGLNPLVDSLFRAFEAKQTTRERRRVLQRIIMARPNFPRIIRRMAFELAKANNVDLRINVWKRLLFAHPDNPDLRYELQRAVEAVPEFFNRLIARYMRDYVKAVGPLDEERWLALQRAANQQMAPWWAWKVVVSERQYGLRIIRVLSYILLYPIFRLLGPSIS